MVECQRPTCADFGLAATSYQNFTRSQWSIHRAVLLAYRVLVTGYCLGYQLYLWIGVFTIRDYIYMTDWTFTFFNLYNLIALLNLVIDCVLVHGRGHHQTDKWTIRYMTQWLFYDVTVTWTCLVLVVYWGAIYDPSYPNWLFDITCHLVPGVVSLTELVLTATPCRLAHVIYPLIYGFVYLTFTLIYWATGHDPIYPILDYSGNPALAAGSICGMLGFILIFHPAVWGVTKLRVRLATKYNCGTGQYADTNELLNG